MMGLKANSKQDLEDFKSYIIVEKNFSEHTAKAYCSDILSFLVWLEDTSCEDVNFSKVRDYLHFIQKFNYKKTTIARKIASLRTFYKFLYRERKVNSNPAMNLNSPKRPDAFFASSDVCAAAAVKAASRLNLSVPGDVAIVGFDNIEISYMLTPSLTTINQPRYQMGLLSADMITRMINKETISMKYMLLDTELIIRESTVGK